MLSFGTRGLGVRAVLAVAVLAIFVAACGAASAPAGFGNDKPGGADIEAPVPGGLPGEDTGNSAGGDRSPVLYQDVNRPDLLIIKTGAIVIQVAGIDEAVDEATQVIVGLGGYASASERSGDDEDARASVTYRIPADRWEEALTAIRALGEKVIDERSGTQDVTAEVVDLGARIKNLQATELAFQQIMTRATDIEDVLAVQAELTKVRGEIERLTAQKAHLEEQAALSTLTVTFSLTPNPILASQEQFDPATEVDEATASLVTILQAIATAGIWFAIVWLPIVVVLAVLGLVGFAVVRRVRRSTATAATSPGRTA